jgi:hypothetical protein
MCYLFVDSKTLNEIIIKRICKRGHNRKISTINKMIQYEMKLNKKICHKQICSLRMDL